MRYVGALAAIGLMLAVAGTAQATPAWYRVTFTGDDLYQYTTGTDRATDLAPRRYRDWSGTSVVQYDTWSSPAAFASWVSGAGQNYGYETLNLWGAGTSAWGVPFQCDDSDGIGGYTSWNLVSAPPGWIYGGIVAVDPGYNPSGFCYPVWRPQPQTGGTPTGEVFTWADHDGMSFTFDVLIKDPSTAFEPDGKLRVFFGGYSDEPTNNYELSGVMVLNAVAVPEPVTMAGLMLGIGGLVTYVRKRRKAV
jgi:hypothetical protein